MIFDSQATYSHLQDITAIGDTPSTNSNDHYIGNPGPGLRDLMLMVTVDTAFASSGAATLQVVLQDSANNATWADLMALTPAMPVATLTAKKLLARARYPGNIRRYSRVVWRVAGAAMTAGSASARIALDADAQQYFQSGFKVAG